MARFTAEDESLFSWGDHVTCPSMPHRGRGRVTGHRRMPGDKAKVECRVRFVNREDGKIATWVWDDLLTLEWAYPFGKNDNNGPKK